MAIRLDYLAKRIPFKLTMHLSQDTCHSSRYTCKQLGLGAERHVTGRTDGGGYFNAKGKVITSFYREAVPKDDFGSLVELFRACPEVARRARKCFADGE